MGDIDGGWAWFVLIGCTVMTTIMAGTDKCFGLIYLELLEVFGDKAATTAWVTALAITIRSMLGPVVSVLCSRFGCRAVSIAGGLLTSTGMILSAFRFSLAYMFFTFGICTGVGTALLQTAIWINITQHFKKKVTLALCISSGGGGIGAMIAPLVFIFLLDKYGFSGTMLLFGGIMANIIPAGILARSQTNVWGDDITADVSVEGEHDDDDAATKDASVDLLLDRTISSSTKQSASINNSTTSSIYVRVERSTTITRNADIDGESGPLQEADFSQKSGTYRLQEHSCCAGIADHLALLKQPGYIMRSSAGIMIGFAFYIPYIFLPALAEERGISDSDIGVLLTVLGSVDLAIKIPTAVLMDRKTFRPHRQHVWGACTVVWSILVILLQFTGNFAELTTVAVLFTATISIYMSLTICVLGDIVGKERQPAAIGLFLLSSGISTTASPFIIGMMKDLTGSYDSAFYLGATGIVGGLLHFVQYFCLPITKKEDESDHCEPKGIQKTGLHIASQLSI